MLEMVEGFKDRDEIFKNRIIKDDNEINLIEREAIKKILLSEIK